VPIPLEKEIVYGPINSRRFGLDLGINILPTNYKLCSFDCIYCQYGWTGVLTDEEGSKKRSLPTVKKRSLPTVEDIERNTNLKMRDFVKRGIKIKHITISGNGEPTLHPKFSEIVDILCGLRDKYFPDARIAVLSNATTLQKNEVVGALNRLDERVMKLDAGNNDIFYKVDKPFRRLNIKNIVDEIKKLKNVIVQTMFLSGENDDDESVNDWIECLRIINPIEVQIYSLDRPSADENLKATSDERLSKIADIVKNKLKINAYAFIKAGGRK
jgi:wyosine [tRNA(Phe)-imidazoG37] synthetase (radical SAM superfamily)